MKTPFFKFLFTGLLCYTGFTYAGDSVRVVIKTPQNGHTLHHSKGASDPKMLYSVDDDRFPFTGKFVEYNWDNDKTKETNFVKGEMHGEYMEWSKSYDWATKKNYRFMSKKCTYVHDVLTGEYTEWMDTTMKSKTCYYDKKGERHGKEVSYTRAPGKKMQIAEGVTVTKSTVEAVEYVKFYKHGKKDSTWTWYFNDGRIKEIRGYKNDMDHGPRVEYSEKGHKKNESTFVNNKEEGTTSVWFDDGVLAYTCQYLHGKKHGEEVHYSQKGQKRDEGEYVNGDKKGRFVWYKEDGTVSEETTY